MDTSGFFSYPTAPVDDATQRPGFLDQADQRDWDTLLAATQGLILSPGDVVFAEGQADRALYLVTDGVLGLSAVDAVQTEISAPPAEILNEVAFLDGGNCVATARAATQARVLRLSYDAYEALAAREPRLARRILLDLARMVTHQLRQGSARHP